MKAGMAMALDTEGKVIGCRLMGGLDQCLDVQMPFDITEVRWCTKSWPHEDEHDYSGGPASWA